MMCSGDQVLENGAAAQRSDLAVEICLDGNTRAYVIVSVQNGVAGLQLFTRHQRNAIVLGTYML